MAKWDGSAGNEDYHLLQQMNSLPLRQFFQVTNIVLVILAAGLLARGIHEFNEAGIVPSVVEHVWNTNGVLEEKGLIGQLASALFGCNGNPSLTEVVAYCAYFVGAWGLWRTIAPARHPAPAGQHELTA